MCKQVGHIRRLALNVSSLLLSMHLRAYTLHTGASQAHHSLPLLVGLMSAAAQVLCSSVGGAFSTHKQTHKCKHAHIKNQDVCGRTCDTHIAITQKMHANKLLTTMLNHSSKHAHSHMQIGDDEKAKLCEDAQPVLLEGAQWACGVLRAAVQRLVGSECVCVYMRVCVKRGKLC